MELFKDIEQQIREIHDPALDDYDARITSKLGTKRRIAEALERLTRGAVEEARQMGLSWSEIGEALGISKQAAHQKYAHTIRETGKTATMSHAELKKFRKNTPKNN